MLCLLGRNTHQLDSTTNYDDRRKIRARIREVMDDKEGNLEAGKEETEDFHLGEALLEVGFVAEVLKLENYAKKRNVINNF